MLPSRSTRAALAVATALLAAGAPAAQAGQDLRSPDARDAGTHPYSDYARDATRSQDLRSPDARDVARGVVVSRSHVRTLPVVDPVSAGFSWADAAIGAATGFGLALLGVGGFTLASRRRLRTS